MRNSVKVPELPADYEELLSDIYVRYLDLLRAIRALETHDIEYLDAFDIVDAVAACPSRAALSQAMRWVDAQEGLLADGHHAILDAQARILREVLRRELRVPADRPMAPAEG